MKKRKLVQKVRDVKESHFEGCASNSIRQAFGLNDSQLKAILHSNKPDDKIASALPIVYEGMSLEEARRLIDIF